MSESRQSQTEVTERAGESVVRRPARRRATRSRRRHLGSLAVAAAFATASVGWLTSTAGAAGGLALKQPSDPFLGSIAPAPDADVKGMFGKVMSWPLVSIHATLAQSGEIITYGAPPGVKKQEGMIFDQWNPTTNAHRRSGKLLVDSFCNIAVPTTGGRLMMAGGNSQTTSGTYDTKARTYSALPNFAFPRWYASMIRLPDERFVVMGGAEPKAKEGEAESRFASTPEILTPGAPNWKKLTGAKSVSLFGSPDYAWWYPKAYLAPDGNVFGISQERMWTLDPDANGGKGSVTDQGRVPGSGFGSSASSVMFEPGKILLAGGGQETNTDGGVGSRDASVIDISASSPVARATSRMAKRRNWPNLTVLPDGEVLATGGTEVGIDGTPAKTNEMWNPDTGRWRTLDSAVKIRTYHSTALLMPSGGVFTSGGGVPGPVNNLNTELYYPPNLFTKVGGKVQWADRPEFRDVVGTIARGGWATFGMKDDRRIASMSLTTAGSVTHAYNSNQRRIPLAFSQSGTSVSAQFPAGATTLPSGLYLLHAVDTDGVPAPSQLIEIMPDDSPGAITVYGVGPKVPPKGGPAPPAPSDLFTGLTPARLLDTREGDGPLGADESLALRVTGVGGVPDSGVSAVALNVTVAETTAPSFLTVSPRGVPRATVSNLNWDGPGMAKANAVVVKVGDGGMIDLYNLAGRTHVIVDVAGWFGTGGGFRAIDPTRVLDSRSKLGRNVAGPVGEEAIVLGFDGSAVPANAAGVVFNATATGGTELSFVTAYPSGLPRPDASSLNVFPGVTTSNLVVSALGADGEGRLFNRYGSVHLLADVAGYFEPGSGFGGMNPSRLLDTRTGSKFGPGEVRSLPVRGVAGGVPASARVVILNVTALLATAPSFVTVYPTGAAQPNASNLNFGPGMVVPNLVFAAIGDDDAIEIANAHGQVDVLVDVLGYLG